MEDARAHEAVLATHNGAVASRVVAVVARRVGVESVIVHVACAKRL